MAATTKFHFTFGTSEEPRSIVPTTVRSKYRPAEVQRRVGPFPDSHRSFAGPPSLEYSYAKAPSVARPSSLSPFAYFLLARERRRRTESRARVNRLARSNIGKVPLVEDLSRRHHQNFHRRNAERVLPSDRRPFAVSVTEASSEHARSVLERRGLSRT